MTGKSVMDFYMSKDWKGAGNEGKRKNHAA
jgi:hypothetical protein